MTVELGWDLAHREELASARFAQLTDDEGLTYREMRRWRTDLRSLVDVPDLLMYERRPWMDSATFRHEQVVGLLSLQFDDGTVSCILAANRPLSLVTAMAAEATVMRFKEVEGAPIGFQAGKYVLDESSWGVCCHSSRRTFRPLRLS